MKKHRYQIAALMMSVIIATGSLSGSVFAAETSSDTKESSVVEDIEETDESEIADERAGEGSENESEQENKESAEDTSQETEGSVEDTQDLDEKEENHDESVPEEIENNTGEEKTDSSADTVDTPVEETDTMDTSEEGKEENQSTITVPAEQESISKDVMNSDQPTDENVVASGNCGENATWKLTGTESNLTLTISGSGGMDDFSEYSIPWASRRSKVKTLVVEDGITYIGEYAFYSLNKLVKVSLPDSITSLGNYVFSKCASLSTLTIPDSVTSIGSFTFYGCSSLTRVTIPDSVTSIGYEAFYECSSLKEIHISSLESWLNMYDDRSSLSGDLYLNNQLMTKVVIPSSETWIRDYAFNKCRNLKTVIIPDSVEEIGEYAFSECTNLANVTMSNSIMSIGEFAFNECKSLTNVTIPNSIMSIGRFAFCYCKSLKKILLPDGVTSIEPCTFMGCNSLTFITIPDSVTNIGPSAFSGCESLKSVTIPDSVAIIEDDAFGDCESLTSVVIPKSVRIIEGGAFSGCKSLTKAVIPQSVISIGWLAFFESDNLTIYYQGTKAQWESAARDSEINCKKIIFNYFSVDASFKLSGTSFTYTGKAIKPAVTVSYKGSKLVEGKDYKLVFKNNTNPGTATVNVNGIGNYSGTATLTFKITAPQLKKPGNCRFVKWNNSKYSSCNIAWNKVTGAQGYETLLSWTNGSHASKTVVNANTLSRNCTVATNHVSQMKVRAFVKIAGKTYYSPWSNVAFITPSPSKLTTKNVSTSSKNLRMKISWNIIYGCNGYNVFVTTNPNGKWNWNQSTSIKADATSAVIDKCNGKLKKNTRYYVRIVTRRKQNGVFCTVPMPANNTYIGSFVIK